MNKQEYEQNPQAYWSNSNPAQTVDLMAAELKEARENPLWFDHVLPEILKHQEKGLCLDLGCGGGRYIAHAAEYYLRVIGIDFSRKNLEATNLRIRNLGLNNVSTMYSDLGNIELIRDNTVDFAYSVAVFMHMPNANKLRALKEISRVLRPSGLAVLIEIPNIEEGAFDCPDIDEIEWHNLIIEAGLQLVEESPADPFTKLVLRKEES